MATSILRLTLAIIFLLAFTPDSTAQVSDSPVKGKIICLDPGHGGTASTDSYRVGPTGEREEWINLRVALILRDILQEKGAKVIMTRTEDSAVALTDRSKLSNDEKADVFISIHHNATADPSVNFPIIYFHGNISENKSSVALGKQIGEALVKHLFSQQTTPVSVVSDFTIFPEAGASVLRHTYGTPAVLAEASFFTNPAEEQLLKTDAHNRLEAVAYLEALEAFFSAPKEEIKEKNSIVPPLAIFKVFQEAERMTPIARRWKQDFEDALLLMRKNNPESLEQALELFTRSAKSFPDSYVAAQCHQQRAIILDRLGKTEESKEAAQRAREFYADIPSH